MRFQLDNGVEGFPRRGAYEPLPERIALGPAGGTLFANRPIPRAEGAIERCEGSAVATVEDVATAATLSEVRAALGDCRRCKLCEGRTQIVFGVGNPEADLMFIGEGPGYDEDRRGEPFVGRAGQLLTDIITKGMRLRREDVYIANVVKCRPPENRDPEADEVATCRPFLLRQIEIVRPKVLVALGRVATQALLGVTTPIGRLRGQWQEFAGIRMMPTLHPAYLLRNPNDKRLVWNDIQMVMDELGLARP